MLITLKNKETLKIGDFYLKCSIGRNGLSSKKKEGDKTTPIGLFSLGKLYYRSDRLKKPETKINTKIITRKMGWCDDPKNKFYNKEIKITKKEILCEKLFKKDNSYNYLIAINYNKKKTIPFKGSAIFIHLTKNYEKTAGCIALKEKDFLILAKLINKRTKIKIT
jgi:L,D-peptidoglycan transpeptidase YkuD (ErfK/YbiS/YcfS/YnhG family)